MSNHTAPAFKVSVSPGSVTVPSEAGTYHGTAVVTDYGTEAVTVKPQTLRLGPAHSCSEHGVPWLKLDARSFGLAPGHSHTVSFTVADSPTLSGRVAVVAMASPARTSGHLRIGGGVGESVTVGTGKQVCTKPVSAPAAPGGTSPYVYGAIGAAVLLLVVLVVLVGRKARRS